MYKMKKLKYEKFRKSNEIITVDLNNGYTIIAVSTWDNEQKNYITTFLLKDNNIDIIEPIEEAKEIKINADRININSAVLKQISVFLEEGFFTHYINRYVYEMKCFDKGNDLYEKERLGIND